MSPEPESSSGEGGRGQSGLGGGWRCRGSPSSGRPGPLQASTDTGDPVLILSICALHLIADPGPLTFFYFVFLDLL